MLLFNRYTTDHNLETFLQKACFLDPRFKKTPHLSSDECKSLHSIIVSDIIDYRNRDMESTDESSSQSVHDASSDAEVVDSCEGKFTIKFWFGTFVMIYSQFGVHCGSCAHI